MDKLVGTLILATIFLPIVIAIAVIWFIVVHADEIAEALVAIAKGIWFLHKAAGYGLLLLVRDLPVHLLETGKWQDSSVRAAVILWLSAIPIVSLTVVWILFAGVVNAVTYDWAIALILTAPTIIGIGVGYYLNYFERPVRHHRWPRFMAQPHLMQAERELSRIENSASAHLWMAENKQAVRELVKSDERS